MLLARRPRLSAPSARRKAADPGAELTSTDNMKRRRDTTELSLGGRGIEKLDGAQMATFPNLAVLWLNDNRLTKLKGLDDNSRLTTLHLNNNRISSIATLSCSLPHLRYLEVLLLHDNEIVDLQLTLGALEKLSRLRNLNLFNNPAAEENNYRALAVHRLRALELLDRHAVLPDERQKAAALFSTARIVRRMAFGGPVEPWDAPAPQRMHSLSTTERWLIDENARVRGRQRARAARAEHAAFLEAHQPSFDYACVAPAGRAAQAQRPSTVGAGARLAPAICVGFGELRAPGGALGALARASGAAHVFLRCDLWGIPAHDLRTGPVDARALEAGSLDWRHAEIATAGREAEAYAVLLHKQQARRPTGAEYRVRLELFGLSADGTDSKWPLATGTVDLAQVRPARLPPARARLARTSGPRLSPTPSTTHPPYAPARSPPQLLSCGREDGRMAQDVPLFPLGREGGRVAQDAPLFPLGREGGAAPLATVQATFEVAWSPYSTMAARPALRKRAAPPARSGPPISGDLTRDALAYLTALQAEGAQRGAGGGGLISREAAASALRAVGCRADDDDVAALLAELPAQLPARELAAALGGAREALYASARKSVSRHIASGCAARARRAPIGLRGLRFRASLSAG